jgi:hypothetical protein
MEGYEYADGMQDAAFAFSRAGHLFHAQISIFPG